MKTRHHNVTRTHTRRVTSTCLIIFFLIIVLVILASILALENLPHYCIFCDNKEVDNTVPTRQADVESESDTKLILAYTEFYGNVLPTYGRSFKEIKSVPEPLEQCEYKCEWSVDKGDYPRSSAVVFHLYNHLEVKDFVYRNLPRRENPNQKWVLLIVEPPAFFYPHQMRLLNGNFNLSMTYHSDSDIHVPVGGYWKRAEPLEEEDYLTGKDNMVVWLASNCVTESRREQFVNDLRRFIPVDVFGLCGVMSEENKGTSDKHFRELLAKQYKYYIAFENSDCDDYITERFWASLKLGMIPIVRGHRPDYKKFAPPNSYIHADSFITARNLARHLRQVSKNSTLFHQYHEWRKTYEVGYKQFTVNTNWMCDLCEKVHTAPPKTLDVYEKFSEDTRCFTYLDEYGRDRAKEHMEDIDRP